MKKITILSSIINWTWEFPQTLLGFLLSLYYKVHSTEDYNDIKLVLLSSAKIGISLGRYILLYKRAKDISKMHEYGHCRQSKILGPTYLLIVGIPSITLNIISRIVRGKFSDNYYNRFPENWADKLGAVNR